MARSLAEEIALLPDDEREKMLAELDEETLLYDADFWLRPEQIPPDTDWNVFLALAGRGFGKAIELNTPVLTMSGWSTMGDLKAGDYVFDEQGQPTRVKTAFEPFHSTKVYTITFDDETQVVADAEHEWVTQTYIEYKRMMLPRVANTPGHRKRLRPDLPTFGIRTTKELAETPELKHTIQLTKPLQYPMIELPIDPYTLGAWLGDGTTNDCVICGVDDEIFDKIAESYTLVEIKRNPRAPHVRGARIGWEPPKKQRRQGSFNIALNTLDLRGHKHVPRIFFQGSIEQRLELLRGIMDTDGTVNKAENYAGVGFILENLRDDVNELLISLGYKTRCRTKMKGVAGRPETIKPFYTVDFRPDPARQPFHLKRKAARVPEYRNQANRHFVRYVKTVEPAEPCVVRCIEVESENHLFLVGRGLVPTHNSRALSEFARKKARTMPGSRGLLVARTAADVRDTVVGGESGILNVSPPSERPEYFPSKRQLVWPNGSSALLFSADEGDQLRGPQGHWGCADEVAAWRQIPDDSGLTTWDNLRIATRLGEHPQIFAATTPKNVPAVRNLLKENENRPDMVQVVRGKTSDNKGNLSEAYIAGIYGVYAGTALERQELEGELIISEEGALWTIEIIDGGRYISSKTPSLPLRVVAVDPSVAEQPRDECGIVVVGATDERQLHKRNAYVLEDTTVLGSPEVWAKAVVETARRWKCPIVAEKNQGHALITAVIKNIDSDLTIYPVWSSVGKRLRAEPVAAAYQQRRVHHVNYLPTLETQMTSWVPETTKKSPDRVDALVHGVTALLIAPPKGFYAGGIRAHSNGQRTLAGVRKGAIVNRAGTR